MKKIILATFAIITIMTQANAQKIKGSETVLPLTQKTAEVYLKSNPKSNITVTGGGSGVGISSLIEGTTDIAQASRKMKFDERQKIQEQIIEFEFEEWLEKLSTTEKNQIAPTNGLVEEGSISQKMLLKDHFIRSREK